MAAALEIRGLHVSYGNAPVLEGIDLTVAPGETTALLGPSGSGKTTLLYAVAGFLSTDAGEILVSGKPVVGAGLSVPPERRRVGMVFQHYALWPHMTALETAAYPLRRQGLPAAAARAEALRLLERMGVAAFAARRPAELSGGQQQRVGLARALARNAALYLFDEPTAHLDAPLRASVQAELAERRLRNGAAALHATHDAAEALAVADRVALLRDGRIVQEGTPQQVYEQPAGLWEARLTGPAAALEVAAAGPDDGTLLLDVAGTRLRVDGTRADGAGAGRGLALVRPEWARLGGPLAAQVAGVLYRGAHTDYRLATTTGEVVVRDAAPPRLAEGEEASWSLDRAHLLPPA